MVEASEFTSFTKVLPYTSLHGVPILNTSRMSMAPQSSKAETNRSLSLPPSVSVTSRVEDERASTCGATPGYWEELVTLAESAPEHDTSFNDAPRWAAVS